MDAAIQNNNRTKYGRQEIAQQGRALHTKGEGGGQTCYTQIVWPNSVTDEDGLRTSSGTH